MLFSLRFFLLVCLFCSSVKLYAQADSLRTAAAPDSAQPLPANTAARQDSVSLKERHAFITPKKTALFSAILPGLGQVYNRQYWKVAVIYAGAAVAAYYINDNLKHYNEFRNIYAGRLSHDPAAFQKYPEYSESTLEDAMAYYRRYLDLSVILTAAGYALQVMDAVVFAHLKHFDISPDISLHVRPVAMPFGGVGMGLVMNF